MLPVYDVIVVGAGHAGCEAAAAAATMGSHTLLITMDMNKIAQMSCNPAVGGIAKGQIVREIDALGGQMGLVTDKTSIQFRMLNRSKGPAMWSPRAQSDRMAFSAEWRRVLENIENLDFWQDTVTSLIIEDATVKGVVTRLGVQVFSKNVILTNGTFLNGLMHVGKEQIEGGRVGEASSKGISEQLAGFGFEVARMKTGTPARLDARSINFSELIEQKGEDSFTNFSFLPDIKNNHQQRSCYIAYTSEEVHESLRLGFEESPLYNGTIQGRGPRYCPSIEDKIVTFAEKNKHQLFLEPEGEDTIEYYINGFSSSLAWDIQLNAMRKIKGLEDVKIFRPGYAIEYDYYPPTQLHHTLETKKIQNLYFAGQINGTTGYEEAAAQGLIAGINAVLKTNGKDAFIMKRDQSYIGVLVDDLVTKGVDEPYRMFTSRAEYRILLRQDNADIRLTELGYRIGLASRYRFQLLKDKLLFRDELVHFIKNYSVEPVVLKEYLIQQGTEPLKQKRKLLDIVLRPQVNLIDLIEFIPELEELTKKFSARKEEIIEAAEILIKYSGYIDREKQMAEKIQRLDYIVIQPDFDFNQLKSLSTEARQKLTRIQPKTIGQASRIPGVSPSDISVLLVYFGR